MARYRVFLLDPENGVIMNPDGTWYSKHQHSNVFSPEFDDLEGALRMKDQLLSRVSWGCVEVYDLAESKGHLYSDPAGTAQFEEMRGAMEKWWRLPFFIRWLFTRPPDPRPTG